MPTKGYIVVWPLFDSFELRNRYDVSTSSAIWKRKESLARRVDCLGLLGLPDKVQGLAQPCWALASQRRCCQADDMAAMASIRGARMEYIERPEVREDLPAGDYFGGKYCSVAARQRLPRSKLRGQQSSSCQHQGSPQAVCLRSRSARPLSCVRRHDLHRGCAARIMCIVGVAGAPRLGLETPREALIVQRQQKGQTLYRLTENHQARQASRGVSKAFR